MTIWRGSWLRAAVVAVGTLEAVSLVTILAWWIFSTFVAQHAGALLVCASPFFNTRRQQLVVLATSHGLPAIFEWRDFVVAGWLMSYGTSLSDAYRQAGVYVGRILKGAKASDLPIVQSTKLQSAAVEV